MNVFLTNFWEFTGLRYFTKCTLIVIKSIAKISFIDSYLLFRARTTAKLISSKICVVIYNSFTNIVLVPISVFKLTCLLNIPRNLATFFVTSGNFRCFSVSVSNFYHYQIIFKVASFTPSNHGRLLPQIRFMFLIRCKKYLSLI